MKTAVVIGLVLTAGLALAGEPKRVGKTDLSEFSVDQLIDATEDPSWQVRWDAVNELGVRKDIRGAPALAGRALYDENPHPRWRSLWAVSAVDREGEVAIPILLEGLKSDDPIVVRNAAVALSQYKRKEALPELLQGLEDPDDYRRWEALFCLRSVGGESTVPDVLRLLDENNETAVRVRSEAVLVLGRIGGRAQSPALLEILKNDSSLEVRWRAALALSGLGDPEVIPELKQQLEAESQEKVREAIQNAINRLN